MMFSFRVLTTVGLLALASTAWAGESPAAEDLPLNAQALRDAGMDADQVREALVAAHAAKLSAAEATALLQSTIEPVETNGPIKGFGGFVKTQLDAGLRGTDLAGAISSEHENRGLGKGGKGKPSVKPSPSTKPRPGGKPHPRPTPHPAAHPKPTPKPTAKPRPVAGPKPVPAGKPRPRSKFKPKGGGR